MTSKLRCYRDCDLKKHQRYHIPLEQRRHVCIVVLETMALSHGLPKRAAKSMSTAGDSPMSQ